MRHVFSDTGQANLFALGNAKELRTSSRSTPSNPPKPIEYAKAVLTQELKNHLRLRNFELEYFDEILPSCRKLWLRYVLAHMRTK